MPPPPRRPPQPAPHRRRRRALPRNGPNSPRTSPSSRNGTPAQLTASATEDGILSRHFLESILCAEALPVNVSSCSTSLRSRIPWLPIALIRNEDSRHPCRIAKQESRLPPRSHRTLGLTPGPRRPRRNHTTRFDCVTLRAVDEPPRALPPPSTPAPHAWLALMSTQKEFPALQQMPPNPPDSRWNEPVPLPRGTE